MVISTPPPKLSDGNLNIVIPEKTESLHPLKATSREIRGFLGLIYENLMDYDNDGNYTGKLASAAVPDQMAKTWTITLRPQVRWQGSGRPLDADDVVFTLNLMKQMGEECVYRTEVSTIMEWEKIDDTTFSITFEHAYYGNIFALNIPVLPRDAGFTAETCPNPAVGTGPFMMRSDKEENGNIVLQANPAWWKQPIGIDTITARRYSDTKKAGSGLALGQVDAVQMDVLTAEQYAYSNDIAAFDYVTPYFEFLAFNFASEKVSDIRFRRAIYYAIDRSALASGVYQGHVTLTDSPYWVGNTMLRGSFSDICDREKSLQLLKELHWSEETSLALLVYDSTVNPLREEAAGQIVRQLKTLGLNITMTTKTGDDFTDALNSGKYDLIMGGFYMSEIPDLSFCLSSSGSENLMKYESEDMDRLLRNVLISGPERFSDAIEAVRIQLLEDLPMVSLYFRNNILLTTQKIGSIGHVEEDSAFGDLENWKFRQ